MAAGGSGTSSMYTVHYRRTDGTEASGQAEPNEFGGFSWLAPEDCAAVTGLTEVGGGGAGRELWTPMPGERAVFAGMRVTVLPGTRPDPRDTVGHQIIRQPDPDADVAGYVALYGPPGAGPGWSLAGYTADGGPVWQMNYPAGHGGEDLSGKLAAALERDPTLGGKLHDVHGGPCQDCWCGYAGHDPRPAAEGMTP